MKARTLFLEHIYLIVETHNRNRASGKMLGIGVISLLIASLKKIHKAIACHRGLEAFNKSQFTFVSLSHDNQQCHIL